VLWWFVRQIAASKQGGFYEFKPMYVTQIPVPSPTNAQRAAIESRVERILSIKRADPGADVSALEAEIDVLVYRLYGLTDEEIAIVDGRS
jgi:hypothetical protein